MNDLGGVGILGVIVGVFLVLGLMYFAFGERMGIRSPSNTTTVKVEVPKVPSPNK